MNDAATGRNTGVRWMICALLFFATTINYMDRQILGILAPTLQQEIGWNEKDYSNIVTAFQAAYAIGLIGFGRIIDSVGTKFGYSLSIILWSIAAMAHAMVKTVMGFGVVRFALGFGEAGNFPAAIKAIAEWFPKKERALATGLFNSGSSIGAIIAPVIVPWLTVAYGWRASFIVLGATGIIWVGFWCWLYNPPAKSRLVSSGELAHIRSDPPEQTTENIPWRRLMGYRQTWAYIVSISFVAPIWWFYLYWLPKFLNKQYGLDLVSLGAPLIVIYSMACVGSIGGGWLSSSLLNRGWSLNASRKTAMLFCAICVVPVIFASKASNLWLATALIGLAAAAHQGWAANLYTLVSDMFPKSAVASVVGLGAMFGSVTAMAFAQFAGHILQTTGNYWILFVISSSAYLAAFVIMHALVPGMKPVEIIPKSNP
jgi:ACS family hexuronate transporter-like MFS transporter